MIEENLRTTRLTHRAYIAGCATVLAILLSGSTTDPYRGVLQELRALGSPAMPYPAATLARARSGFAVRAAEATAVSPEGPRTYSQVTILKPLGLWKLRTL